MSRRKILVVDDRIKTLKGLVAILEDENYQVIQAASGPEALEIVREREDVDAVLADLKMPGMTGLELFRNMNAPGPAPPFIIMTGFGTVRSAVEALKEGVTDYLIKPLDYEVLLIILDKAVREREMSRELAELRREVHPENAFHGIIGGSRKMQELYSLVRTVGPTDASVLIIGETGTGKELLARALHLESSRQDEDLVCINCAALTETLLETELFGHVKGAFTGAAHDKKGRLEAADRGSLFLDEIGHMSLALQAKLLRFLQEMTFEPVGGTVSRRVDVRLITATNLSLQQEIQAGRFLPDLFYRIEVITLNVPSLRERKEDLPLLVDHFVRQYARQYNKDVEGVTVEAMEVLTEYDWPGNIREMQNCLARAVILSKGRRLDLKDLSDPVLAAAGLEPGEETGGDIIGRLPSQGCTLQEMESELIRKTLEKCRGNKSLAAKLLGISRKALYQKMGRLGIESTAAAGPVKNQ